MKVFIQHGNSGSEHFKKNRLRQSIKGCIKRVLINKNTLC